MTSVIQAITGVFTEIGNWFISTINTVSGLFYDTTDGLTFLGTLAICGLGIALITMVINLIKSYLRFK